MSQLNIGYYGFSQLTVVDFPKGQSMRKVTRILISPVGFWDLRITNPDGGSVTAPNAFYVESL